MTEKEILLISILDCPRSSLYNGILSLNDKQLKELRCALSLRARGFPLQYILCETEFFGLTFKVDEKVFIPRPETEILVEKIIEIVKNHYSLRGKIKILDIGTGSGCIAISLAKSLLIAKITAVDISIGALEVAKYNSKLNNVGEEIEFIESDLFGDLKSDTYDLIVSNPPYIPSADIENLQREIKYEPRIALDGGRDGFDFYRRIIKDAPKFLKKGGFLFMEIGFGQRNDISEIASQEGKLEILEIVKDYSNIERILVLHYKKNG